MAQCRSLSGEQTFRALYDAETGAGLGDSDILTGAVSWGWFARLFGAFALDTGRVVISDPYAFGEQIITWTQHGVRITRGAAGTEIAFPSGETVTLPPDAEPQIVRDPAQTRPPAPSPDTPVPPSGQSGVK
jgi:hypothetical protein